MRRAIRGRRRPDAGLSLVELMIALVVIAVAILALFSLVVSSSQVQQETREKTLAYNAARLKIEEMRNQNFVDIYALYNSKDDPTATRSGLTLFSNVPASTNASEPGNLFTVAGLTTAKTADPEYPSLPQGVGRIIFPETALTGGNLTENPSMTGSPPWTNLQMPRDLNQDGDSIDAALGNPTTSGTYPDPYTLLPVKIRVRWGGVGDKVTQIEVTTLMTNKFR